MKTTIEKIEPCIVHLHGELPPEIFLQEQERVSKKYQKYADVPENRGQNRGFKFQVFG